MRFREAAAYAAQSCSSKLLLLPKAAPQSFSTRLFPKAASKIIESSSE
jgi:hypothetical protein